MPGPPPFGNRWYAQDAAPDVLGPMEAQGTTVRPYGPLADPSARKWAILNVTRYYPVYV